MKIHRLAEYFPILEGEEFDLLVEDIKKNGQLEPIVMVDGEILDGVNRWRACEQLGIEPKIKQYTGIDPLGYVISENIRRRHLDTSQRAMLATEMLPEFERQAGERKTEAAKKQRPEGSTGFISRGSEYPEHDEQRARDDAAKLFGVSGESVQRAKRIKAGTSEEVVKDIIRGKRTVGEVDNEIRKKKYKDEVLSKKTKNNAEAKGEALIYLSKLREVVLILPAKIPKEGWSDGSFAQAQAMVEIILKRLEDWK